MFFYHNAKVNNPYSRSKYFTFIALISDQCIHVSIKCQKWLSVRDYIPIFNRGDENSTHAAAFKIKVY